MEEKPPKQTSPNQAEGCLMLHLALPAAHTHFLTSFYHQSLILTSQIHYLTVHLGERERETGEAKPKCLTGFI